MWTEDEQWFDRFSQGASVRPTSDLGEMTQMSPGLSCFWGAPIQSPIQADFGLRPTLRRFESKNARLGV